MKTTIITICFLLAGITTQAQQALQKYYTAVQALENQADSEEKSKTRGKALAVFHDERVKEAGTETAKNEAGKLFRQYLDYDLYASFYFLMRLSNTDDGTLFINNYATQDERAKIKLLATRNVTAYNTQSKQPYPSGVPLYGNGVKGSWQNSGIAVILKDPNSNLASVSTNSTARTITDDGTEDFQKGVALYQAKNYTEAMNWFKKSAEKGNAGGMEGMALMYLEGLSVEKNFTTAQFWYEKALLTNPNNEEYKKNVAEGANGNAEFFDGFLLWDNNQKEKALDYFLKAEKKGHIESLNMIARFYLEKGNYDKALAYFHKAADKGNVDAVYVIGMMYYNGHGVTQNSTEAFSWFKKAAEKGNSGAMFSIGAMYFDGEGVSTNYSLAKKWLEKALEKGDLPIGEQLTANAILDTIEENN